MSNLIHLPLTPRDQDVNNLTYSDIGQNVAPENQTGAFIGNGKIGMLTEYNNIDIQKTIITTDIKYSDGVYKTNIIEPFYLNRFMFIDDYRYNINISTTPILQTLNMSYATFAASFEIKDESTLEQVNIENSLYCPYHMPYCIVQSIDITPIRPLDITQSTMNVS